MSSDSAVVDASVLVDVLIDPRRAPVLVAALDDARPIAPAHVDAEVASALARIYRAGELTAEQVEQRLVRLASMAIDRRDVAELLVGAWNLRDNVSMLDALYVVLAEETDAPLLTADARLSCAIPRAVLVDWRD